MKLLKQLLWKAGLIKPKLQIVEISDDESSFNTKHYGFIDSGWREDIYKNRCKVKE